MDYLETFQLGFKPGYAAETAFIAFVDESRILAPFTKTSPNFSGSSPQLLLYDAPQDLVLSTLYNLFNIFMKPLGEIIRHPRMKYHQGADDAQ